ncbi:MAG: single-stranded DNA-binding protein [Meiothermus sp.]
MGANLVLASGVLGRHELRYTPRGTPLLEIALVGKRPVKDNFVFTRVDFTFYGKLAEAWAQSLVEGAAYQASGRLEYESWEVNGRKGSRLRVVGEELHRLEGADVREEEKGPVLYGADNRVFLIGGLTADPELRQTSMKTPIAKAQLGFSTWDGQTSKSHYVELEAWGELAEPFKSLKKGSQVMIEGALKTEVWEDRESKAKRYKRLVEVGKVTALERLNAGIKAA